VVRQHPDVQHVGVGQDQVRAAADRRALLLRRVAVVDRGPQVRQLQRVQGARLVLGERLGRVEVERARLAVARERVEHRQVERERLPRRGPGGDDRVARVGRGERLGLVGIELLDPDAGERRAHLRVKGVGDRHVAGTAGAEPRTGHELLAVRRLKEVLPGQLRPCDGHAMP
jgi:hypothetical protein